MIDGLLASPDLGQVIAHHLNDDLFVVVVETKLPIDGGDRSRLLIVNGNDEVVAEYDVERKRSI